MDDINFKKYFLRTLVTALSISALMGIAIFLTGDFGMIDMKLLMTTLTISGYSLTGLCCTVIYHRNNLRFLSVLGMIISIIGFVVVIGLIWELINIENIWKTLLVFIILPVSMAHASLLLKIRPKTPNIRYILIATIVCIFIVALMLIHLVMNNYDKYEFFFRILGVFAILDVLGTIVTPILNKITEQKA